MGLRGYKANAERQQKIAAMRAKGMTLKAIGEQFDPELSPQHVMQILQAVARDEKRACVGHGKGL